MTNDIRITNGTSQIEFVRPTVYSTFVQEYEWQVRAIQRELNASFWDPNAIPTDSDVSFERVLVRKERKPQPEPEPMPIVSQSFAPETYNDLFYFSGAAYVRRHVAVTMDRAEFTMPEAIALVLELPANTWIAGGFAASYINGVRPSRFDLFFGGEASFLDTLKRIQNAPEGSYLHGYVQTMPVTDMIANRLNYLEFTHPAKPTLILARTRWYQNAQYLVDTMDLVCEQVVLGSDLFITHSHSALQDAKDKILKLYRMIWRVNTAMDIPRYEELGYRVVGNDRYNSNFGRDLKGFLAGYVASNGRNPPPFTHL